MRKWTVVLLLLTGILLVGCGPKTAVTPTGEKVELVAKVDDQVISVTDYTKNFMIVEKSYKELYGEDIMSQAVGDKTVKDLVKGQILTNMVMELAVKKALMATGVTISPEQIQENYDKYMEQGLKDNKEQLDFYKANAIDEAFIKQQLEHQLYVNELKNQIAEKVNSGIKVDSTTFKSSIVKVGARHVLVKDQKLAEELLVKLQGGADFTAIAKEFSIEPGAKESGGDLGFFGHGAMVKPFEDAAFALKTGEISGVVETEFGFHIIKSEGVKTLQDLETEGALPEEIKALGDGIISAMVDAAFTQQIEAFKSKAVIETFPEAIQ